MTAAEVDDFGCDPELCQTVGVIEPRVFGIRDPDEIYLVPTGNAAQDFAEDHLEVGYPVLGVGIDPCSAGCSAALGQACVGTECRQYPVVKAGGMPEVTGMNFWDGLSAQLVFTKESDGEETVRNAVVDVDPIPTGGPLPNEDALRCHQTPVDPSMPPGPNDPEERLERVILRGSISLEPGHFYRVQVKNTNGTYYHFGEAIPVDPQERQANGRTVHLCRSPDCVPIPSPTDAACELLPAMPACSAAIGGTWLTPPPSIAQCKADFGEFYDNSDCPQTPRFFLSDPEPEGTVQGPTRIYVTDADPQLFVQTQLAGTWCRDETGGDALGDDELVVWVGAMASIPAWDDLDELEHQFNVYWDGNSDAGEKKAPRRLMASTRLPFGEANSNQVVLRAGENDEVDAGHVIATVVGAVAGGAGGFYGSEGDWIATGAGALAGGFSALGAAMAILPDPDDEIGQAAWQATLTDVSGRAILAHDGVFSPGPDPEDTVDPSRLRGFEGQFEKHLTSRVASKHPAVDAFGYVRNEDLQSCANDANCDAGEVCFEGACVPSAWTDGSGPKGDFDPAADVPGTMEIVHLDGEGEYLFYVSTSLSDEGGL